MYYNYIIIRYSLNETQHVSYMLGLRYVCIFALSFMTDAYIDRIL